MTQNTVALCIWVVGCKIYDPSITQSTLKGIGDAVAIATWACAILAVVTMFTGILLILPTRTRVKGLKCLAYSTALLVVAAALVVLLQPIRLIE